MYEFTIEEVFLLLQALRKMSRIRATNRRSAAATIGWHFIEKNIEDTIILKKELKKMNGISEKAKTLFLNDLFVAVSLLQRRVKTNYLSKGRKASLDAQPP